MAQIIKNKKTLEYEIMKLSGKRWSMVKNGGNVIKLTRSSYWR